MNNPLSCDLLGRQELNSIHCEEASECTQERRGKRIPEQAIHLCRTSSGP